MEEEVVILQAGHNEADRERAAQAIADRSFVVHAMGRGPAPGGSAPSTPPGRSTRQRTEEAPWAPLRVATRFEAAEVADNFVTRLAQFRLNTNQHDRNNPTLRAYAVPPPVEAITPAEAAALHAAPRAYEPID